MDLGQVSFSKPSEEEASMIDSSAAWDAMVIPVFRFIGIDLIKLLVLLTIVVWMTLAFREHRQQQNDDCYWWLEDLKTWPQNKDNHSELPTVSMYQ